MESPKKAENKEERARVPDTEAHNDSEDDVTPPSPIQIASEPALASEFSVADAGESKRIALENQNRLKTILEVAGVTGLTDIDARTFQDPEILRKLTNSVSSALDEATTALTRMKSEKQTYEAFLRGANQSPLCSPLTATEEQQQKELKDFIMQRTEQSLLQQQQQQQQRQHMQQREPPGPPTSTVALPTNAPINVSSGVTLKGGGGGAKGVGQSKGIQAPLQQPQQLQQQQLPQQRQQSTQAPPSDSMQTVQRLLTQGHTIQEATEDGESLLSLACSAGYYELAEVLLRMRASVEDRGMKGDSTPLMEAASGGYSDIVKLLIDHGANVNAKSSVGNTALTYACCGGYEEVVHTLLKARADVEHQNDNGHTPLMEAASCGHVAVAKLLLDYGANINTHSNEFKESALTLACYKGHLEMVKFLLNSGADQEHKTDEMHTALMEASMDGHVDVARLLLDHGAQVNMPADSFESPLTLAACGGHYELAALLLSRGADLGEVNDEGYTPLMESAREGHEDVVKLLVEHGANVNAQSEETQETALGLASCGGFLDVVQYLVEHGADIELGASTPLMEAAQEGHINIIRFLIEKKANVRAVTNTGDSALTYACAHGHSHIAEILLQFGAELEHESEGGRTPLMKAARAGHAPTVRFLVAKGADVNRHTTNNDHTVLSLASAGGHTSVVKFLLAKGAEPAHLLRDNSTMLIEACRGGHTDVVKILMKQPKETCPEPTPSTSPTDSDRDTISGPAPAPSDLVGGSTVAKGSKVRPEAYRESNGGGVGAAEGSSSCPALRHGTGGGEGGGAGIGGGGGGDVGAGGGAEHAGELGGTIADDDMSDLSTSKAKRPKVASDVASDIVSSGSSHSLQYPQYPAPVRSKSKSQQVQQSQLPTMKTASGGTVQYATDSASAMKNVQNWSNMAAPSPFSSPHSSPLSFSKKQQQLQQQQQQLQQQQQQLQQQQQHLRHQQQEDGQLASQMAAIVNYSHLIPEEIIQDHETHEELVARRIYNTPEKSSHAPTENQQVPSLLKPEVSLEDPTSIDCSRNLFSSGAFASQTPVSNSAHSELTRIASSGASRLASVPEPNALCDSPLTGSPQIDTKGQGAVGALRQGGVGSNDEASHVSGTPLNPDLMYAQSPPASERLNPTLPNIDHKLIPHLEALADLLQNPSTLVENQYLLALAARAQFFSSSLPPSDGGGDLEDVGDSEASLPDPITQESPLLPSSLDTLAAIAAHVSQGNDPATFAKGFPGALEALANLASQLPEDERGNTPTGMDIMSLLASGVDLTKLLPMLAAMEMQGSLAMEQDTGSGVRRITDPGMARKIWDGMDCVESNPGYVGGLVGEGGIPAGDGGMAGERGHQAMDYVGDQLRSLQAASGGMRLPKHQYPMALLDGNFQLDIPPPGELGDAERHQLTSTGLRSGYTSPLEQESFPTSEEDDEEDEEDDDEEDEHGEEGDLDGEDSSSSGVIPIPPEKPLPKDFKPAINIDQQTESNHDTALTLAAAGGYDELVGYLLDHGARVEHRDKKGCTPLILAASGGYPKTVSILLDHKANIEAQSDRTKDTALSLACSGGKQEVVEMLLNKKANFEHRNVSDYTPLSLAASGGYVHIIKLLLKEGADINSRTGSKLGISPLMLAAMNGHTSTVKLLLDRGSDINAQIETNRNTALTLACFQGRHEVVQLLVERNANVEHRAKTGLTPLMEAASGGYHEVGKVLINRGADVNAAPVPSSKDTALTIAADKGHYKFVELILRYGAHVDVKNKKGNSPLWLAANGGHLDVVRLLVDYKADVDSQDNRKVSCLMAAFRKGHEKVIRYLVKHVNQFPSDSELTRYINTLSDADHAKKCEKCVETIITAKEEQANKAIKNADKLLEEIDAEKKHEEDRKAAAARKRAKKKRQKEKKQQALKAQKEAEVTNGVMGGGDTPPEEDPAGGDDELSVDTIERSLQDENDDSLDNKPTRRVSPHRTPKMDSNTLKPSQSVNSSSTNANISTSNTNAINQRLEQVQNELEIPTKKLSESGKHPKSSERGVDAAKRPATPPVIALQRNSSTASTTSSTTESAHPPTSTSQRQQSKRSKERERERGESASSRSRGGRMSGPRARSQSSGSSDAHIPAPAPPTSVPGTSTAIRVSSSAGVIGVAVGGSTPTNSPRKGRKEDGWKEVGRRTKKVTVPVSVYNLMVSKSSGILASIKQATNTQVDADKHTRQSSSRVLTIRGSVDGIKLTQMILHSLSKDPGQDVQLLIQKSISSLSSGPTPSPSVSSSSVTSSNKRHATSSQGIPLSVPQDIIDSMAPPAKGSNAMVASVNAAISPVVTMSDMTSVKAPIKKPGSGTPSVTQAVSGSIAATKVAVERTSTSTVKPLGSQQQLPVSGKHPGIPGPVEHVPTSKAGLIPFPSTGTFTTVAGSVSSMQMVSSGFNGGNSGSVANTVLTSSSKPVVATVPPAGSSGVARRLFSHQHPGNNASSSAGAVPMATSNTTSSLLGPQPANYPAHTAASPHLTNNQASLTTKSTSSHSSKATPHSGLGPVGSSKQPKSHAAAVTASKDKPPPSQPPLSQPKSSTSKMHYSNVISTGTAPGSDSQSAPPLMMGGMSSAAADIIEQPMHQIMNTPMLFHDQITRTKKKSTYSDAVGKKNDTSLSGGQSGKMPTLLMHSSHVMGSLPTMQQAQQQQQQQQQLQQQQQQPKLNLAPGSRPMGPAAASGDKGHGITEPRHGGASRPLGTAWNDIPGVSPQAVGPPGQAMDRQRPPSSGFQEAFQKYSVYEEESNRLSPPPVVTSGGLGPIGPPNKHSKHPQASVPPPLPPISSSAHTGSIGGKGPSSGPSNIHSFSPSAIHTPHSKTSPPTPSPSQRNEVSPATKSPLLGTAPPGFPPPDGKNSLYFKPIPQQHVVGGEYTRGGESPIPNANPMAASGSNYPTLVPTPVRASRPPLLATPPGYYGSPGPSPDKNSPNKSPPHPNIIKASGFNPNAPTFVPMSSRMQLPPTSSILGPPPKYPPTYPPSQQGGSGGSSILGNAPQLPGGAVGGPSFNTGGPGGSNGGANQSQMMSPSVFAGQGPAPPPPPLPPSQQPPTQQQQQQQQQPPIASQHMPPPPPPSHPMNHMTPSCSSGSSHQGLPPPLPSNQSSILGQPPTPPLNHHHHMYPPHQQGGTQNFHNAPPARQHGGAHGQAPINPSVPMFGHQLETGAHSLPPPAPPPHPQTGSGLPPPGPPGNFGGLNMMSPYQMPPSGNGPQANIHRQPLQNIGSSVKDPFSSSLDTGGIGTLLPPMPLGGSSNSASPYVAITSSDINKFGIPGQHFPDKSLDDIPGIGGSGGHSILLRPSHDSNPPGGVIGAEVGGGPRNTLPMHSSMSSHPLDNFFGMSIKQLGGLSVSQVEGPSKDGIIGGRAVGSRPSKSTMGMEKFPSSVGLDGFGRQDSLDGTSIHFSSGSSMLNSATTSTSYYVMTPGALPSSSSNSKKDSQFVSTGMVPIGAERAAHKSAALPPAAAFPGFSPNVWSYSNQKSSEESDWLSHLPGHSSQKQEPPALSSTATGGTGQLSGSEVVATSLDNLETVLQKLSLGDYLHLFQKNEIDLNALKLMGETDFAEIGLPPGPCQKLLSAMKSSTQHQPPSRLPEPSRSSSASNQLPPVGSQAFPYSESSSRSSSRPATRPSSRQQHSE